jgi:acid stress-induced BolA-like protein IbaG/YrbA
MSLMNQAGGSLSEAIEAAIVEALGEATAEVHGSGGGHFSISVTCAEFAGKSTLQKHRMVLRAVAPFMDGDDAPVHAVDHIETRLPE